MFSQHHLEHFLRLAISKCAIDLLSISSYLRKLYVLFRPIHRDLFREMGFPVHFDSFQRILKAFKHQKNRFHQFSSLIRPNSF
jgi:hypothetical protein